MSDPIFSEVLKNAPPIHVFSKSEGEFFLRPEPGDSAFARQSQGNHFVSGDGTKESPLLLPAMDVSLHYGIVFLWYGAQKNIGLSFYIKADNAVDWVLHASEFGVMAEDGGFTKLVP